MSLEDRLSVPDGPLRKNRRRYRNLCPRKTTGCQLHASSPVEKRQSRSKKKNLRSHSSWLYGFHSIFISPLPIGRIFPGALASTYSSPSVYTSPRVLDGLEGRTNGLHDSISIFFPPSTILSIIFPLFFGKSLFAAKGKVWSLLLML